MTLLILGLALWCGVHLYPAIAPRARAGLVQRLGANPYRGLFSVLIIAALALIVLGWRSAIPTPIYTPPVWTRHITMLLVFVAFVLFFAAQAPTNLKRVFRHPQLTGVHVWGLAHLLANGDARSIVLFGTFAAWPIVEMSRISRRDGPWQKPDPQPRRNDVILVLIATAIYVLVAYFHGWLFGMPVISH